MKKVIKLLAILMCALLLVSLTACSGFMSASQVNNAVKEFGTPQAEMTLSFTTAKGQKFKYVIVYDLQLEKTPITTINFINLVNDGFYNDAIFDSYNSSNNYFLAGRYTYRKDADSDKAKGAENPSGITMVGEFKSNKYAEPKGGYEQFSLFSLAMYHENTAESVDSANGALIFSTASSSSEINKPLNYANYAVFAKMVSISIYEGINETPLEYTADKMNSLYLENLTKLTSTATCSMTTASGDTKDISVLGENKTPRFVFSIKMLGDKDWSKLPKVN